MKSVISQQNGFIQKQGDWKVQSHGGDDPLYQKSAPVDFSLLGELLLDKGPPPSCYLRWRTSLPITEARPDGSVVC